MYKVPLSPTPMSAQDKPSVYHKEQFEKIWSSEGISEIECWSCCENLDYEDILSAIHESNGVIISCACGKEYEVNIGFKVTPLEE